MTGLLKDARFALRQLRRSSGFTAVAILTLAFGIGATTAIFSIVEGVLLRPLPFPNPDRLVALGDVPEGVDLGGGDTRRHSSSHPHLCARHACLLRIGRISADQL